MLEIKRIKGYLSEHTDYSVRDYVCVRTAIKVRAACRFSVYGSPVDGVFFFFKFSNFTAFSHFYNVPMNLASVRSRTVEFGSGTEAAEAFAALELGIQVWPDGRTSGIRILAAAAE